MALSKQQIIGLKILFKQITEVMNHEVVEAGGHPGDENFETHELFPRWKETHDLLVENGAEEWVLKLLTL